jgi:hypothetical protein
MAELGTTPVEGPPHDGIAAGAPARVVAVFERGDAGTAALREAAELVSAGRALTVLTLAPQARPARWGRAGGEGPYNIAVREEAKLDLSEAREILGSVADRAAFAVLAGCPQPRLASWVTEHEIGLVLLPRRRFAPGGHPFARSVRRDTAAELRLVR